MNRKQIGAYACGVLTVVLGGVVGKYLLAEAGAALIAAGAFFLGKIQDQPRAFRPGARPTKELDVD